MRSSIDVVSNGALAFERFSARRTQRNAAIAVYLLTMLGYLAWRLTIVNAAAPVLSILYLCAELLGALLGGVTIFCACTHRWRAPRPAPPALSVDVFIPTWREPAALLRWTLIAAREIDYPHRTIVLDDGNRAEVRALAAELGVDYLARAQNTHAKAGNLNHGLANSRAEFVLVFDADHIAMPHALDVTLGHFDDARVALVQTPEEFYNVDAFQFMNARRSGALWHDQSFFYGQSQPARDARNGASCIGTGVVYRRSALDVIGGIPTATVTEDMHTSLRLHKAGFEVAYLNEPIAFGIAAADIRDYYNTRHRWAHGNLHVLRTERVLTCPGLTLDQRLSYLTLGLIHLEGWQQLLLFTVPIASLLFGWAPFVITPLNVLVVLLFPIVSTLVLQEIGSGLSRIWVNELYSMARFPLHIAAWAAVLQDSIPFRTSSKNIRGRVDWQLMAPQLSVLVLSLGALGVAITRLSLEFKTGPLASAAVNIVRGNWGAVPWHQPLAEGYTLELVLIAGFWAAFNATKALLIVRKAIRDARRSHDHYRFAVCLPLELSTPDGPLFAHVDRIARDWLSAELDCTAELPREVHGTLHLPAGPIEVVWQPAVLLEPPQALLRVRGDDDGLGRRITGALHCCDQDASDKLLRALHSQRWQRVFLHPQAFFLTPLDALAWLLHGRSRSVATMNTAPTSVLTKRWRAVLCRASTHESFACAVARLAKDGTASIIAFRLFAPGVRLELMCVGMQGNPREWVQLDAFETHDQDDARELDGSVARRYRGVVLLPVPAAAAAAPAGALV